MRATPKPRRRRVGIRRRTSTAAVRARRRRWRTDVPPAESPICRRMSSICAQSPAATAWTTRSEVQPDARRLCANRAMAPSASRASRAAIWRRAWCEAVSGAMVEGRSQQEHPEVVIRMREPRTVRPSTSRQALVFGAGPNRRIPKRELGCHVEPQPAVGGRVVANERVTPIKLWKLNESSVCQEVVESPQIGPRDKHVDVARGSCEIVGKSQEAPRQRFAFERFEDVREDGVERTDLRRRRIR